MTERGLHLWQAGTVVNRVRPVSVAQPVRGYIGVDAGPDRRALHHAVDRSLGEAIAALAAAEHRIIRAGVAPKRQQ